MRFPVHPAPQKLTVFLHLLQKLDDDLGAGSDQDLSSSALLSIRNCF